MPRALKDEEIWYDLSSYLPRIIPCLGVPPRPLMLITSTTTPPLTSMQSTTPYLPPGSSTLNVHTTPLPHLCDLIRQILQLDLSLTPNFGSPYKLTTRRPLSAILMEWSWSTTKSGDNMKALPPRLITPHPRTRQMLFCPGSYEMRDRGLLTFLSPTREGSSTNLTTSRS